jgi:imidazolonepropionase
MLAHGTTAFECKSGYGLSADEELRALRLARELGERVVQRTASTALLAHAVPEGFTADGWMDEVERLVPEVEAQALDVYVETVAFSVDHLARMGELAARHGLALRAHVEQFSTSRSVPVALEHGARSVDHLACLHPDDLGPLAGAECAAVLLPGAELLGDERVAPARGLADAGAICALATDLNPGTSPVLSLPLIAGIAVRRYGWSVREALLAVTLNAAWVIGRSEDLGSIEAGKRGDLVLLDCLAEHVPYRFGRNPVALVLMEGRVVYVRPGQEWRIGSR